ncbi:tetratricopeptide repeat protein [Candidatus Poribacteria bacterium]|nr:tetratricopeptide repeat protein [Candidatus Poribacteria bacterium]
MKANRKYLLGLLMLGILISCARVPQQIVSEKPVVLTVDSASKKVRNSTVRVVSLVGTARGYGSGFFVAPDKIATNIHVVADYGPIFVESADEKTTWFVEGVVAFDVKNDLVILKLAGEGMPFSLGNSDTVKVGDTVTIVGYPAEKYKVTQGTVQSIGGSGKNFFLKVDAPKGSSGGAVIDRDGQVIGIVSSGDDFHTYAIPANVLKVLLDKPDTIESLGQWHNRDSIRAYAYFVQSEIKNYAGNYKAEIVDLDKAVQLNAALILPYIHRGIAKRNLGDAESTHGNLEEARRLYKAAIEDYTQAITLDPEFFFAYNNRGNAKHALGRYKAAVEDYTQAIALNPEYVSAYDNRGNTKYALGRYKAAIEDYTQVITLDPEYISAYINRGHAKFRLAESAAARENTGKAQRLYEAAIEDYTQAIKLNTAYIRAYQNRAHAQFRLGESKANQGAIAEAQQSYGAVIEDLTQVIQLAPKDARMYDRRGVTKIVLGDYEGAIADFDSAIHIKPEEARFYTNRARAKEALGQLESAKADFEKAKELDSDVRKGTVLPK